MAALRRPAFSPSRSALSSAGKSVSSEKATSASAAAWRTGQLSSPIESRSAGIASGRPARASSSTARRRTDSSAERSRSSAASKSDVTDEPYRGSRGRSLHPEDGDQLRQVLGLLGEVACRLRHLLDRRQVV